ncbi:MAG: NAD(P)-binding domain-containing protein, partial [Flavobacteriaceae bacterium]
MIKIVLLGAGNVGTHLCRALQNKEGLEIIQWYNRSLNSLEKELVPFAVTQNLNDIIEADLYIISVSDTAIPAISKALKGKNGLIAHTAGSIPMEVLGAHQNHGIFYPLQTFSKQKEVDFNQIPLCLEA